MITNIDTTNHFINTKIVFNKKIKWSCVDSHGVPPPTG